MAEQHESYRLWDSEQSILVNQLNQLLGLIADRLDRLEGLRGTPQKYDTKIEYPNESITGILTSAGTTIADFEDALTLDSLVVGDGTDDPTITLNKSGSGDASILFNVGTTEFGSIKLNDAEQMLFTTDNRAFKWSDGNQNMIFTNAGYLGLGTSNPDCLIDINAATGGNIQLTYNDSDGSATDYCKLQVGSDGELTITTVDSDGAAGDIALMPDGNVGIATASPTKELTVNGDFLLKTHLLESEYSNANYFHFTRPTATGTVIYLFSADAHYDQTRTHQAQIRIYGPGSTTDFMTFNHNGAAGLIQTGSGPLQLAPATNVGISTSAPDKTLEINKSDGGEIRLTYNDGNGSATDYCDFKVGSDGNLLITTNDSDGSLGDVKFQPDGVVQVYQATGNSLFRVSVDDNTGASNATINFQNDHDNDGVLENVASVGIMGDETKLRFIVGSNIFPNEANYDAWTRVTIDGGAGNLGVGTSAPDKALEISRSDGGEIRLTYNDSDGSATDYCDLKVGSDGDLTITTVDSDGGEGDICFMPDGNVGINTTSPNQLFTINQGASASLGFQIYSDVTGSALSDGFTIIGDASANIYFNQREDAAYYFYVYNAFAMALIPGGNFGIGTTLPDKKLEINASDGGEIRLTYNDSDGSATDYCDFKVGSDGDLTITTVDSDGAAGDITLSPDGDVNVGSDFILAGDFKPSTTTQTRLDDADYITVTLKDAAEQIVHEVPLSQAFSTMSGWM